MSGALAVEGRAVTARPCGACIGTGRVTAVRPRIGICVIDWLACDGTGRNEETT